MKLRGRSQHECNSLIEAMQAEFVLFFPKKFNCSFLTSQCCLEGIILVHGNNNYEILHIGKAVLESAGILNEN